MKKTQSQIVYNWVLPNIQGIGKDKLTQTLLKKQKEKKTL